MGRSLLRPYTNRNGALCFFRGGLGRKRLGLFHQLCETRGVLHGDIGQNLTVQRNTCGFQTVDELAVGDAIEPGSRADALNPQAAILPLLYAAIALGITIGAIGRFLSGLVELALGQEEAMVLRRYFLRRARRFVPRFTRGMGFLLHFFCSLRLQGRGFSHVARKTLRPEGLSYRF